jgi:hypothetical protein
MMGMVFPYFLALLLFCYSFILILRVTFALTCDMFIEALVDLLVCTFPLQNI